MTTAVHRSVISAWNTAVPACGKAIVCGRDAGGGGTAITLGDGAGRGVPGVLAAAGEALAVRAAARGLAVPGDPAPPAGPEAQPDTSTASMASAAARRARPAP